MIKDLMGKMQVQDSLNSNAQEEEKKVDADSSEGDKKSVPNPPMPPKPPKSGREETQNKGEIEEQDYFYTEESSNEGGIQMTDEEGIIIDLGDGLSLNVPIKKKMSLQEFLKVAEKVKALETLSEDNQKND